MENTKWVSNKRHGSSISYIGVIKYDHILYGTCYIIHEYMSHWNNLKTY